MPQLAETSKEEMDENRGEKETPEKPKEMETPEEETKGEETPETPEAEKPDDDKSKELQSAIAQKKAYRVKYEKAQKELNKLKETPETKLPTSTNPMEVVKLAKALEGYSEEEVSFITRNATDESIDGIIKATKDDWVKTAIQSQRDKVDKEKGTPSPTSPASIKGKSDADIAKMSDKEYNAFIRKTVKHQFGGNRGI